MPTVKRNNSDNSSVASDSRKSKKQIKASETLREQQRRDRDIFLRQFSRPANGYPSIEELERLVERLEIEAARATETVVARPSRKKGRDRDEEHHMAKKGRETVAKEMKRKVSVSK